MSNKRMGKYEHLTLEKRSLIEGFLKQGKNGAEIARLLEKSTSSISYELRENGGRATYNAEKAQSRAKSRYKERGTRTEKRLISLEMQVQILSETLKELLHVKDRQT